MRTIRIHTTEPIKYLLRFTNWQVQWDTAHELVLVHFASWGLAIDYLDRMLREGKVEAEDVVLAGPTEAPWVLEHYLSAAEAADVGDRKKVFDEYGQSALKLYGQDSPYRSSVERPWETARA